MLKALRQRKIDRVAAAYGVAAWLVVQGAAIVLPTFGAPQWTLKVLIVAVIVGFPLAMFIAWHAAPHPHYKRGAASPTYADIALLALLGVVVLLSLAQFATQMGLLPAWLQPASLRPGFRTASLEPPEASSSVPEASIAVLPFLNMSGDPKKEYFSDGISEELLNDLSNASNLRVAARTSSFAFKGRNEDIRKIARALNVRAVLEGSVREDGEHIRITAQLINAADGYHLWSKTYDRDLSNVLVVQDEIAREITAALTHRLLEGSAARASGKPVSIDAGAYRKYLEGQSYAARKTDEGDARAVELFKRVTAAQPDFAAGFAALGRTYIHMAEFHNQRADLVASAEAALNAALRLDPNNLEALSTHLILSLTKWDWEGAAKDARRLQAINPHSVFTLRGLQFYYQALGFPRRRLAALEAAIALDPLSFVDRNNFALLQNNEGDYAEAASSAAAALRLQRNRPLALFSLCWANAGMRRLGEARAIAAKLSADHQSGIADACELKIASASGNRSRAHALADKIAKGLPHLPFNETDVGQFYAAAGDLGRAIRWFDQSYDNRNYDVFSVPYFADTPAALLKSAAWKTLMRRPRSKAWQSAHDRVAATVSGE